MRILDRTVSDGRTAGLFIFRNVTGLDIAEHKKWSLCDEFEPLGDIAYSIVS